MLQTSLDAYRWALNSGHLRDHMAKAWSALRTLSQPPTAKEFHRMMVLHNPGSDGWWKDLSDLEQKGAARKVLDATQMLVTRECHVTGQDAYVWVALEPPWIPPPTPVTVPRPKLSILRQGFQELDSVVSLAMEHGWEPSVHLRVVLVWLRFLTRQR